MKPLLGWLRLSGEVASEYERLKARQLANAAARKELDSLRASSQVSENVHARLVAELDEEAKQLRSELETLHQESPSLAEQEARLARLHMIKAGRSAIQRGLIEGVVPAGTGERLLEEADHRLDRLTKQTPHGGA
jgi:DNA repair exonuclease SbcCD ATPase subunit